MRVAFENGTHHLKGRPNPRDPGLTPSPHLEPIGWRWAGPNAGTFLLNPPGHPAPSCAPLVTWGLAWADVAEVILHDDRRTHTLHTETWPPPRWQGGVRDWTIEEREAFAALLYNNPDVTRHRDPRLAGLLGGLL